MTGQCNVDHSRVAVALVELRERPFAEVCSRVSHPQAASAPVVYPDLLVGVSGGDADAEGGGEGVVVGAEAELGDGQAVDGVLWELWPENEE